VDPPPAVGSVPAELVPFPDIAGVPGSLCGIGGNDSMSDAPNDDDGLKGLIPPKPVDCGLRVGDTVIGAPEPAVV
jgi:hypothetical protein